MYFIKYLLICNSVGDEVWDADLNSSESSRIGPKPDFYFGFHVQDIKDQDTTGFMNDSSVKNYTIDTLTQLSTRGLRSVPVSATLSYSAKTRRDKSIHQIPLVCFPWCIVQIKGAGKADSIGENKNLGLELSHQASLAASSAQNMLENLARFADVKQDSQHIPPVVTITSVGPHTTVWLAFSNIVDDEYLDYVRNLIPLFSLRNLTI